MITPNRIFKLFFLLGCVRTACFQLVDKLSTVCAQLTTGCPKKKYSGLIHNNV